MTTISKYLMTGAATVAMFAGVAAAQVASDEAYQRPAGTSDERVLTDEEIDQLIGQTRDAGIAVDRGSAEFEYLGGPDEAAETQVCCEPVQEQVTEESREEVTETFFDAVTTRTIIQPIERTIIQPIERQVLEARDETETEATQFEEERLETIVESIAIPATVDNVIEQETVENTEEVNETFVDVVTRRDIIQPVERTTVIPVQRRIIRPRSETVTAETRREENRLPVIVQEDPVPAVTETIDEQVTEVRTEEVTETVIPYVATRDVFQPIERTIIQPIERQVLQAQTEEITREARLETERLELRIDADPIPETVENVIEQVTERVVYEIEDVYIDQITRTVIQPVVVTNIQPIERRILRAQSETITNPTQFEEVRLDPIAETATVPETVVNFIPQITENRIEEVTEVQMPVVTQRNILQPVIRTVIQPVEIRRVRPQTETITNDVRFETIRGEGLVINIGTGCQCGANGF